MISKNDIKYIQSLRLKKRRDEENVFVVEGPKMVSELLRSHLAVRQIYAVDGNWLNSFDGPETIQEISPAVLKQISSLDTPNQVLAVASKKTPVNDSAEASVSIMLDGIQDPGNLGTIIRIADWFGIKRIIASSDTADEYNPKVVQSSMGSIFRTEVVYVDLEEYLACAPQKVYAAMLHGTDITTQASIAEGIILIGNESRGIRPHLIPFIHQKITIPRRGNAESLNAGVALGIILSHLV